MSDPAHAVQKFVSRGGIRIFGIPVETFPGHVNNIYLIVDGDTLTLVDVGSGTDESIAGLRARVEEVRQRFGERVSLDDVRHVVITHAHIDHFGWVGHFTRETGARVWVHELRLLALEEAGAHVEYLFQRGELGIANLDEVSQQANPVIRYETRRGAAA